MTGDDDENMILGPSGITLGKLRRVARLYNQNFDAAAALGIQPRSFGRLCKEHGIETPWVRKRRLNGGPKSD